MARQIRQFKNIRIWAHNRGLIQFGDVKSQVIKLNEEVGEINRAILKQDDKGFKDGIGDAIVVLVNLAAIGGTSAEECLAIAYDEIKDRKGSIKNGSFAKDE